MISTSASNRPRPARVTCLSLASAPKSDLEYTNSFLDEGIYHCLVTNIRGGSIAVVRKSKIAVVVVVQRALSGYSQARPRVREVRKKWTTYQSIHGTFIQGELKGIVTIRYADGSFYEGLHRGGVA